MKYFTICLCLCLVLGWAGGSSAWPQFQHDARHSGFTNIIPPNNPSLVWTKNLNVQIPIWVSPIIGIFNQEEVVYIPAVNGIYCLRSDSGDLIWSRPTTQAISYTPVYCSPDRLYLVAGDSLICLNPQNGATISGYQLESRAAGHVTNFSDRLYLVDENGKLYAFNAVTGELLWKTEKLAYYGFDNQAPAVDDSGYIYVVTLGNSFAWYDYRIYKFNPNGQQIWMREELWFEPGGARMTPSIGSNGDIYFGLVYQNGWSSSLYAYHPNGDLYWRKTDNSGMAHSSPAISGNNNMIIYGAYGNNGSFVRRRDTAGNLSWSYPVNIRYSSPAITGNNWIVLGTYDGKLVILNDGGGLCYQYNCGNYTLTSPCIGWDQGKGAIYVASSNGTVYKFGDSGVGIEEKNISTSTEIKCWPNPFTSHLTISLNQNEKIRIFDASGREIFSENGKEIVWQSGNLPNGIYFIQIGNKQGQKIKVVKLK